MTSTNVAVTVWMSSISTTHVPRPVHAPPHPANALPGTGIAVSVTSVPAGNDVAHVKPQLMPAGVLVIDPLPRSMTVSANWPGGTLENDALTNLLPSIVRSQTLVPLHAPPHPVKLNPGFGVATTLTGVPSAKPAMHVEPQLMPAGIVVTTPPAPPATVSVTCDPVTKVAPTLRAADIVTAHVAAVPEHAPLHPAKAAPGPGVAVRVTIVLAANAALHAEPQLMPGGVLATLPFPLTTTVRGNDVGTIVVNCAKTLTLEVNTSEHDVLLPEHAPVHWLNT